VKRATETDFVLENDDVEEKLKYFLLVCDYTSFTLCLAVSGTGKRVFE